MWPPIVQAAYAGNFNEVRKLINEGCDINACNPEGRSALDMARGSENGEIENAEIAELLIMNGADVDLPSNLGGTPLMNAAAKSDVRLLRILLNNRADLNLQCKDGGTALHYAAAFREPNSIEILLKAKGDVNIKNKHGLRPIDWAGSFTSEMHKLLNKTEIEFEIEEPNSGILFKNPMKK